MYRGPKTSVMGEDPLAGELMNSKSDSTEETDENIVRYMKKWSGMYMHANVQDFNIQCTCSVHVFGFGLSCYKTLILAVS